MVFGFSFAFYVNGFDEFGCAPEQADLVEERPLFCDLDESFLNTLGFFFGGPNQTSSWWLDELFGLVAVVILLNVVIAIVSDAWAASQQGSALEFWSYRVNFLAEVKSIDKVLRSINCCCILLDNDKEKKGRTWLDAIDEFGEIEVFDNITWDERPYF